jgi:hypothetical protein
MDKICHLALLDVWCCKVNVKFFPCFTKYHAMKTYPALNYEHAMKFGGVEV